VTNIIPYGQADFLQIERSDGRRGELVSLNQLLKVGGGLRAEVNC